MKFSHPWRWLKKLREKEWVLFWKLWHFFQNRSLNTIRGLDCTHWISNTCLVQNLEKQCYPLINAKKIMNTCTYMYSGYSETTSHALSTIHKLEKIGNILSFSYNKINFHTRGSGSIGMLLRKLIEDTNTKYPIINSELKQAHVAHTIVCTYKIHVHVICKLYSK